MSNLIYNLDVTLLKIYYLAGNHFKVKCIKCFLFNDSPYDRTNLNLNYTCVIEYFNQANKLTSHAISSSSSFEDLIETCRKEFIEIINNQYETFKTKPSAYKHQAVNKMTK